MTDSVNIRDVATSLDQDQHLTFMLGGDMFAIGILSVKEIIEYGSLTAVPMMPGCIRGVINLRGAVVPVVDLASLFGRSPANITRRTCNIIVEVASPVGSQVMGIVVDSVSEVIDIAGAEIMPPPSFGSRIRADFIKGMGKVGQSFVILLQVDRVLALNDIMTFEMNRSSNESEPACDDIDSPVAIAPQQSLEAIA